MNNNLSHLSRKTPNETAEAIKNLSKRIDAIQEESKTSEKRGFIVSAIAAICGLISVLIGAVQLYLQLR